MIQIDTQLRIYLTPPAPTPARKRVKLDRSKFFVVEEDREHGHIIMRKVVHSRGTKILKAALLALALVVAGWFGLQFTSSPASKARQPEVTAPAAALTQQSQAPLSVAVETLNTQFTNRLRPDDWLATLQASTGIKASIKDLDNVSWQPGQPLPLKILLYARLDESTERKWRDSGIFGKAPTSTQPFIKNVLITNADQFELLRDWHVEGILVESAPAHRTSK